MLANSPLGLEKRGMAAIYKRSDPGLDVACIDPPYESVKKAIIFHDLRNIQAPYSIKRICEI